MSKNKEDNDDNLSVKSVLWENVVFDFVYEKGNCDDDVDNEINSVIVIQSQEGYGHKAVDADIFFELVNLCLSVFSVLSLLHLNSIVNSK